MNEPIKITARYSRDSDGLVHLVVVLGDDDIVGVFRSPGDPDHFSLTTYVALNLLPPGYRALPGTCTCSDPTNTPCPDHDGVPSDA